MAFKNFRSNPSQPSTEERKAAYDEGHNDSSYDIPNTHPYRHEHILLDIAYNRGYEDAKAGKYNNLDFGYSNTYRQF